MTESEKAAVKAEIVASGMSMYDEGGHAALQSLREAAQSMASRVPQSMFSYCDFVRFVDAVIARGFHMGRK